jgi:hypothetical protein
MRTAWVVTAGLLLTPAPALAATPSKLVVHGAKAVTWYGTVKRSGPRIRAVPECRKVSCDRLRLRVKLGRHAWRQRPGGVHVAIRFVDGGPADILQLAVYRGRHRLGASTATVGTAQSVLLRNARNGRYDVYVVDGVAFGLDKPGPKIRYEGLSQVVRDPVAQPVRRLVPDLVALPQQNVSFGPPFEIFDDPVPAGSTCHQSEIDESHAQLCLRFDQVLGNVGDGPLDIRFDQPHGVTPADGQDIPVRQRIYRSDGTHEDLLSGNVHWHAIHGHYHFDGFAESRLWAVDASGNRAGAAPVATGDKVSFCIATTNINPDWWGVRPFGADAYPAPDCLEPESTSGGMDHFMQGMSVGWTDEYNWFLPGQYVEVSGVPDGDYILDTTVDPTDRLIEMRKDNNCGSVRVRLSGMAGAPTAELLGAGPPCTS